MGLYIMQWKQKLNPHAVSKLKLTIRCITRKHTKDQPFKYKKTILWIVYYAKKTKTKPHVVNSAWLYLKWPYVIQHANTRRISCLNNYKVKDSILMFNNENNEKYITLSAFISSKQYKSTVCTESLDSLKYLVCATLWRHVGVYSRINKSLSIQVLFDKLLIKWVSISLIYVYVWKSHS